MRLGIIARCDDTGLGNLTLAWAHMLNPDRIMLIDSSPFHLFHKQHPERYSDYNVMEIKGMPTSRQVIDFLQNVDVVMTAETFYNKNFLNIAKSKNKKTILQYMYEFFDNLYDPTLPLPDVLLSPSTWMFDDVMNKFGDQTRVVYLPPPMDHTVFADNVKYNSSRKGRLLHVGGKPAAHDRNGTQTVLDMLKYSTADYELVVRSQAPLNAEEDERLTIIDSNEPHRADLYYGYDAMVLPRRYAGLSLPMNEALLSGLPVFMTDVSPNNDILPKRWLAESHKIGEFMTRTMLDIYEADPQHLASIIDAYFSSDMTQDKEDAHVIGYSNFSEDSLRDRYREVLDSLA